jgi:hypothetical protein
MVWKYLLLGENMHIIKRYSSYLVVLIALVFSFLASANAQETAKIEVMADSALTKIVPTSFYFAGQSAETQMRNTAAARLGKDRVVLAGLVDTSGYSTEISGKYEGFFITDSPIKIGSKTLGTGAYGFGFAKGGKLNIFDIGSKLILSTASKTDSQMKRPRPLQIVVGENGIRLYKGKDYVLITLK